MSQFVSKIALVVFMMLVLFSSLGGCEERGEGSAWVGISMQASLSSSVTKVTATAMLSEGRGIGNSRVFLAQDLVKTGGQWKGLLDQLPIGVNCTIKAQAFDSSGMVVLEGERSGIILEKAVPSVVWFYLQQNGKPDPIQNSAPKLLSFTSSAAALETNQVLSLEVVAVDADSDPLTYAWSAKDRNDLESGFFSAKEQAKTTWKPFPNQQGGIRLTVRVTDAKGGQSAASLFLTIGEGDALLSEGETIRFTVWPEVEGIVVSPSGRISTDGKASLSLSANDADGDTLRFLWSDDCGGEFSDVTAQNPQWSALMMFSRTGKCKISVTVTDERAGQAAGGETTTEVVVDVGDAECKEGVCRCHEEGRTLCGSFCVDIQTNVSHCGGCRQTCSQGLLCSAGNCFREALQVSVGEAHVCVLLKEGRVKCWGENSEKQLGDGTTYKREEPVMVEGIADVKAIASKRSHNCALLGDGTVKCWGRNEEGQLGNGTRAESAPVVAVSGLMDVAAISVGARHSCALLRDGTVKCWGDNVSGQVDGGATRATYYPSPVVVQGLTGVTALATGWNHTCALLGDGTVKCWGRNEEGLLGGGTKTVASPPLVVSGLTGVLAIAAGGEHSCALLGEGTVKCWGKNGLGQVGDGTEIHRDSPVLVKDLSGVVGLALGGSSSCAFLQDQRLMCWGVELFYPDTWRDSTPLFASSPHLRWKGIKNLALHGYFSCALLWDGAVTCWGRLMALANGERSRRAIPFTLSNSMSVKVDVQEVSTLALGSGHTCALLKDGTAQCWGDNQSGQLGNGSFATQILPVVVRHLTGATAITSGAQHTCALLSDETVRCWGHNFFGQLGDGDTMQQATPVAVIGLTGVTAITGSCFHTCALLKDGTARCWGKNESGQLGDGTTTQSNLPVMVSKINQMKAIYAACGYTCALSMEGKVLCWGENRVGQLGDGTTTSRVEPAEVSGLSKAKALFTGETHACALLEDQTVRCWGSNGNGQLGDGTRTFRTTAVKVVELDGVQAITGGNAHTCALLGDQTVRCWGSNGGGQLGSDIRIPFFQTTPVLAVSEVIAVFGGSFHTCALRKDETIRCWGSNGFGQLGNARLATVRGL